MKKRFLLLFFLLIFSAGTKAQYEEAAIREVLLEAYVNGVYNEGIVRNMELGFSPHFESIGLVDGENQITGISEWIKKVESDLAANKYPRAQGNKVSLYYHRIDINGKQANVKVNRLVGGKPVAVEYIDLLKYPTGWLIVNLTWSRIGDSPAKGDAALSN